MFDIGFLEVLVVFVLGLVVIGPERLPGTIKTCAIWFSRLKRSVHEARVEFEQQIGADEIRREIHNERIMESMRKMGDIHATFDKKVSDLKDDIESSVSKVETQQNETTDAQQPGSDQQGPDQQGNDHTNHKTSDEEAKAKDPEPHAPMIHDESGADASNLPGRAEKAKTEADENDKNDKQ